MIRVGTAGWSYPDWEGVVYPAARADALAWMAGFLDCVEVNSSFYRIPTPEAAAGWAGRVAARPSFLFTVKLWRGFTHDAAPGPAEAAASERAFRAALAPIREAGRLGAVLMQFPYSFHAAPENRGRLADLVARFEEYPLVVEVRHDSWLREDFLGWLRERGAAFCNVDQPAIAANIRPTAHATSALAYVRLHGRNARAWFEEGAGRDRRYDYLYSEEELAGWVGRIGPLAAAARDVFIIANNHYRGQGAANAVEIKAMIEGAPVEAPPGLIAAYPRLGRLARPMPGPPKPASDQGMLPFA